MFAGSNQVCQLTPTDNWPRSLLISKGVFDGISDGRTSLIISEYPLSFISRHSLILKGRSHCEICSTQIRRHVVPDPTFCVCADGINGPRAIRACSVCKLQRRRQCLQTASTMGTVAAINRPFDLLIAVKSIAVLIIELPVTGVEYQ